MSDDKFTTEFRARVYDDNGGFYFEAGEDRDGLDSCELHYSEGDGTEPTYFPVMSWPLAVKMARAIITLAEFREDHNA
jgi:hypothetical protein